MTRPAEASAFVALLDSAPAITEPDPPGGGPFLTVVARALPERLDLLADTLVCLAGQDHDDYEVVVVAPEESRHAAAAVTEIVHEEVPQLSDRVRIISGPERIGAARNAGAAAARGDYLAFCDEDLLLAHWVGTFRAASEVAWGRSLRALAVDQPSVVEHFGSDRAGYVAAGPVVDAHGARYSLIVQAAGEASPLVGWAFPRRLFRSHGVAFDEGDPDGVAWRFTLGAVRVLGVHDCFEATAVARRPPADPGPRDPRDPGRRADLERLCTNTYFILGGEELLDVRRRAGELLVARERGDAAEVARRAAERERDELFAQKSEEVRAKEALRAALAEVATPRGLLRQAMRTALRRTPRGGAPSPPSPKVTP